MDALDIVRLGNCKKFFFPTLPRKMKYPLAGLALEILIFTYFPDSLILGGNELTRSSLILQKYLIQTHQALVHRLVQNRWGLTLNFDFWNYFKPFCTVSFWSFLLCLKVKSKKYHERKLFIFDLIQNFNILNKKFNF